MWPWKKEKKSNYGVTLPKEQEEWSDLDAKIIDQFVRSETGKKFIARQELAVHRMATDAARRSDFSDGIRSGMVLTLSNLKELAYEEPEEQDNFYVLNRETA